MCMSPQHDLMDTPNILLASEISVVDVRLPVPLLEPMRDIRCKRRMGGS